MVIEISKSIDTIQATRKLFIELIEGLSIEALNKVPPGFNNNIIWNFGHVVVTQQILCYKLAGLPLKIDETYVSKYAKGTKPEAFIDESELSFLKKHAVCLIDELMVDMDKKLFNNFKTYTTSFNVELANVDEGIQYLAMHEGLHLGYAMALKKIVAREEPTS